MQQHLSSQLMHGETVRLELRRLPDQTEKYGWIERIPPILDTIKKMRTEVEEEITRFESMDTRKINRSGTLLFLQGKAADLPKLVTRAHDNDENMLELLSDVRKGIEA